VDTRTLRVIGVALGGEGYPNAQQTVRLLRTLSDWTVLDGAAWLPEDVRLWKLAKGNRLGTGLRLIVRGFSQAVAALLTARRSEIVYVPYPSPLTIWWLSFVPRRWRPRLVADAYVSIWDSMFRDRSAARARSWFSGIVRYIEGRSLRAARMVLVDTEANRDQVIQDFCLDPHHVMSLPLAIDARRFGTLPARANRDRAGKCQVLFVGTMIPLHGIECLLKAIELLRGDQRFEFRLIGDGQQAPLVEDFIQRVRAPNVTWSRQWCGLDRLAEEFTAADVCLGVFGGESKAARVLPFKFYYALATGKAIVSQSQLSLPEGAPLPPFLPVSGETVETRGHALAMALVQLATNDQLRADLGRQAAQYYVRHLSSEAITTRWQELATRI
jgi:glycosyltransferase involved in cell wall biosynthesis